MHLSNKNYDYHLTPQNAYEWSLLSLSRLLELVERYDKNWKLISKSLGFFCENECQNQYRRLKANWSSGKWTESEKQKLYEIMNSQGEVSWFDCCIVLKTRSVSDCRHQWTLMTMDFVITGSWTHQEQVLIFKLARDCKFSWKEMIKYLPRRNANSVKSFFNSTIRKITKCLVFRFLKKMLCWPTNTNKSKPLFLTSF